MLNDVKGGALVDELVRAEVATLLSSENTEVTGGSIDGAWEVERW